MADPEKIPLRRRLMPWRGSRYPGPTHSEIGLPEEIPVRTEFAPAPPPRPVATPRAAEEPPWPAVPARPTPRPLLDVNGLLARRWGLPAPSTDRSGAYVRPPSAVATGRATEPSAPRLLDHLVVPAPRPAPPGPVAPTFPPTAVR